jgi:XRE family transcriptional regulator, regulator of sulfur utilization
MPSDAIRIPKQLGDAVRRLRVEEGISQIALAEKAGLNHNFIGEIERGEKLASVVTIVRLAGAFGLRAAELMAKAKL